MLKYILFATIFKRAKGSLATNGGLLLSNVDVDSHKENDE